MRAFFAVALPDRIKDELGAVQKALRPAFKERVSWIRPENLHITIRFLGDETNDGIQVLSEEVKSLCAGEEPLALTLTGLGVFPNARRARVLWCGAGGDVERLNRVHEAVEQCVRAAGFQPEHKPWSPHITLARFRTAPPSNTLHKVLDRPLEPGPCEFKADGVTLFSSTLSPLGARYERVHEYPFHGPDHSAHRL